MALNDTLKTRILLRNDTLAQWENSSLVLGKGEIAIATGISGNLAEVRVGTGSSTWATSEKLKIDTAQVSGLTDLISSLVGNGAKKYKVVANGADGNSWKLQEAPLSAADNEWADVTGSTWAVDFTGLDYNGGSFGDTKFVTKVTEADGIVSAEYAQPTVADVSGLQTALDAKLDKTTFSSISNDIGLSAASTDNPVATKNDIASLDKVMHFRGTVNAIPTSTERYEVGDIVLVAGATGDDAQNNGKEYVLVNTGTEETPVKTWELIGDQNAISALNSYVDTQIGNLSDAVTSDYATKTEVNDVTSYLSGAIDNLSDEITSITGNYATKEYVNGISSSLSTDYVGKISTAKTEAYNEALSDANAYTDEKIADLNINNYATKEYVNGISTSLSTDYVGKISTAKSEVIGESTDLSSADTVYGAKKYADEKIAELGIGDYATKTEVNDVSSYLSDEITSITSTYATKAELNTVSVALSTDYDGKIAALSDTYIKKGECLSSDLSGWFIWDCGGSSPRAGEPTV